MQDLNQINRWSREQLLKYIRRTWAVSFDGLLEKLHCRDLVGDTSTYPKELLQAASHLACNTASDFAEAHNNITHFLGKPGKSVTWVKLTDAISKAAAHSAEKTRLRSALEEQRAENAVLKAENTALTAEIISMRKQAVKLVAGITFHFADNANITSTSLGYNEVFNAMPHHLAAQCRMMLSLGSRFEQAVGDEDSASETNTAEDGDGDTATNGESEPEEEVTAE